MAINLATGRYEPGFVEVTSFDVLSTDWKAGALHRRQRAPQKRRVWEVVYSVANATELTAILSEWDTAKGSAGEVTFRPPGFSRNLTVRFEHQAIEIVNTSNVPLYRLTYRLVSDVLI